MGVWIETVDADIQSIERKVTPFVGVWIETQIKQKQYEAENASHPSWVCGLKLQIVGVLRNLFRSHPSWVCGLKQKRK